MPKRPEAAALGQIRLAMTLEPWVRLFRNQIGLAYQGDAVEWIGSDVLIHNARKVHAGLAPGSSDLVGWRSVIVTPAMLGQRLAVFASLEGKSQRGRASEEQDAWINTVLRHGGLAGIARSADDARRILFDERFA